MPAPETNIHRLAMALGKTSWFGSFTPVFRTGGEPRQLTAVKLVPTEGPPLRMTSGLAQASSTFAPPGGAGRDGEPKTYRAVAVMAMRQAVQARMKREAERRDMYLPSQAVVAERSFAPVRLGAIKAGAGAAGRATMTDTPGWVTRNSRRDVGLPMLRNGRQADDSLPDMHSLRLEQRGVDSETFAQVSGKTAPERPQFDIGQALKEYFYQQSRLPPSGTTAFDPRLTPAWAGLKLPG